MLCHTSERNQVKQRRMISAKIISHFPEKFFTSALCRLHAAALQRRRLRRSRTPAAPCPRRGGSKQGTAQLGKFRQRLCAHRSRQEEFDGEIRWERRVLPCRRLWEGQLWKFACYHEQTVREHSVWWISKKSSVPKDNCSGGVLPIIKTCSVHTRPFVQLSHKNGFQTFKLCVYGWQTLRLLYSRSKKERRRRKEE